MRDSNQTKKMHISEQVRPVDPISTHGGSLLQDGVWEENEYSPESREARESAVALPDRPGITLAETYRQMDGKQWAGNESSNPHEAEQERKREKKAA